MIIETKLFLIRYLGRFAGVVNLQHDFAIFCFTLDLYPVGVYSLLKDHRVDLKQVENDHDKKATLWIFIFFAPQIRIPSGVSRCTRFQTPIEFFQFFFKLGIEVKLRKDQPEFELQAKQQFSFRHPCFCGFGFGPYSLVGVVVSIPFRSLVPNTITTTMYSFR